MTAPHEDSGTPSPKEDGALRAALRADVLSPEALERIRTATEAEWKANTMPPARRRGPALAAAACVATLAVLTGWWLRPAASTPERAVTLVRVLKSDGPGVVATCLFEDCGIVEVGTPIPTGRVVRFGADALALLSNGGALHVARGTEFETPAAGGVTLRRGEIYVDIPASLPDRSLPFTIRTREGRFQHAGTQFSVAVLASGTRLRVREGEVRWLTNKEVLVTEAGTELLIGGSGSVTRMPISTVGPEWALAESLPPDLDIENRLLADYLEWVARQMGRRVEYASPAARAVADRTRLHGSVAGLSITDSLSAVISSTTLQYRLSGRVIRVSSSSEPIAPP